jgi:hypothetical protein
LKVVLRIWLIREVKRELSSNHLGQSAAFQTFSEKVSLEVGFSMAYQYTTSQERGENDSTSNGSVSNMIHGHFPTYDPSHQHNHRESGPVRFEEAGTDGLSYSSRNEGGLASALRQQRTHSSPITILRRRSSSKKNDDTSDDDTDVDESDHRNVGAHAAHQSLPARLLRAPLLGSVPTDEEYMSRRNLLPPPMRLSEQDDTDDWDQPDATVSYGSLRDSQLQGRMLDKPSSFHKDRRIGALRQRVQSSKISMASSAPVQTGLSIGERIQQQRKLQQTLSSKRMEDGRPIGNAAKQEPTSSLAAMLESTSLASNTESKSAIHNALEINATTAANDFDDSPPGSMLFDDSNVLSQSLTGLEILQRGFREQDVRRNLGTSFTATSSTTVQDPSILNRSFSDPVSRQQQSSVQSRIGDTSSLFGIAGSANDMRAAGFLLPPARAAQQGTMDHTPAAVTSMYSYALPPTPAASGITSMFDALHFQQQQLQQPCPVVDADNNDVDRDPDTEGAFDFDME